ncbi:DUF433 domain-containing protein [Corynebacterium argentoratense]|nr:DUF433 domain-containing protein [Corynebacterium argentoratense]
MDAVNNPGQLASKTIFKELYQPFRNKKNRLVPGVKEPHTGIEIDPLRMSGTPTIAGTRVPFDLVTRLATDMSPEEIIEEYPHLDVDDVKHALSFEQAIEAHAS